MMENRNIQAELAVYEAMDKYNCDMDVARLMLEDEEE